MTGVATRVSCRLAFAPLIVFFSMVARGAWGAEAPFIDQKGGAAIYAQICAACHLLNGEGAVGAGRYPALAGNSKLEFASYPIAVVLDGRGAMPPFRNLLDDAQIAAVLNYVRSPALRNAYAGDIVEAEVHRARR